MRYLVVIALSIVLFSCKKEVNNVGYDLLSSDNAFVGAIDTFKILSSTKKMDSIMTDNPSYLLLGAYKDPYLGLVESGFCSQLRLISTSPNFGDYSSIVVDSVVLSMNYIDKYGVGGPLKFEVFRLSEDLKIQTYYSNTQITDNGVNLNLNQNAIVPRPLGSYFISSLGDTVYDQITLKLDSKLGEELIQQSINSPSTYSSLENFTSWFKGLKVKAINTQLTDGQGGVYYISNPPKLTIYYKSSGQQKKYYFELNKNGVRVNNINFNSVGYDVEKALNNTNYSSFYAQSNNLRSLISIPSLNSISSNSVVHSAKLILPYDNKDQIVFNPGYQISVGVPNSVTDSRLRIIGSGTIDTTNHVFIVDIRDHIQSIVSGKRLNLGLYLSTKEFSTTVTRIKFLNEGEFVPKLYIKVSSFKQ